MATINVFLRKNKRGKDGLAPVAISYTKNDKTTYFATGIRIEPENFINPKKDSPKSGKKHKYKIGYIDRMTKDYKGKSINQHEDSCDNVIISNWYSKVDRAVSLFIANNGREPEFDELRDIVAPKKTKEEVQDTKVQEIILIDDFEQFRLDCKDDLKWNTWRQYIVTKNHLETFLKSTGKPKLKLSEFDYKVITDFKKFLQRDYIYLKNNREMTRKGLSEPTIKKNMDRVKKYLKVKIKEGNYPDNAVDMADISPGNIDYSQDELIYLTPKEIKSLHDLNGLPGYLDKARDILLFACSTGFRFGDCMRISPERIKSEVIGKVKQKFIHIKTQKNRKNIEVPFFLYAEEILRKYNYSIPIISNQRLNEYVKEVCKRAGINEKYLISWKQQPEKSYEKWELVSSHTGKKTFIMLHVENSTPIEVLAQLTGNNLDTLKHYYRITNQNKMKHLNRVQQAFMQVS